VQDVQQHLPFIGLGAGEREPDRQAVQGAQQMQAQTQKKREWLAQ